MCWLCSCDLVRTRSLPPLLAAVLENIQIFICCAVRNLFSCKSTHVQAGRDQFVTAVSTCFQPSIDSLPVVGVSSCVWLVMRLRNEHQVSQRLCIEPRICMSSLGRLQTDFAGRGWHMLFPICWLITKFWWRPSQTRLSIWWIKSCHCGFLFLLCASLVIF